MKTDEQLREEIQKAAEAYDGHSTNGSVEELLKLFRRLANENQL